MYALTLNTRHLYPRIVSNLCLRNECNTICVPGASARTTATVPASVTRRAYHQTPRGCAKQSVFEEDTGEEEDEEDEEDDGVSPARRAKEWREGPYDIELVHQVLAKNKAMDVCVVDISEKVDWVRYMVFVTGRSGAHINALASILTKELKTRRKGNWKIDQKGNENWVIVNSGDILVNLFTEEGRLEYDLERVWVLRRNEKNPLDPKFDEIAETDWIYDEEDGMFEEEDPEVAKYTAWE